MILTPNEIKDFKGSPWKAIARLRRLYGRDAADRRIRTSAVKRLICEDWWKLGLTDYGLVLDDAYQGHRIPLINFIRQNCDVTLLEAYDFVKSNFLFQEKPMQSKIPSKLTNVLFPNEVERWSQGVFGQAVIMNGLVQQYGVEQANLIIRRSAANGLIDKKFWNYGIEKSYLSPPLTAYIVRSVCDISIEVAEAFVKQFNQKESPVTSERFIIITAGGPNVTQCSMAPTPAIHLNLADAEKEALRLAPLVAPKTPVILKIVGMAQEVPPVPQAKQYRINK